MAERETAYRTSMTIVHRNVIQSKSKEPHFDDNSVAVDSIKWELTSTHYVWLFQTCRINYLYSNSENG